MFCFDIRINIIIFALSIKQRDMKYNELHRILAQAGCYDTGKQRAGHPVWYSPITGKKFTTSNHRSADVKPGTLKSIIRDSGVKI